MTKAESFFLSAVTSLHDIKCSISNLRSILFGRTHSAKSFIMKPMTSFKYFDCYILFTEHCCQLRRTVRVGNGDSS